MGDYHKKASRRELELENARLRQLIIAQKNEVVNVHQESALELDELEHVLSRRDGYFRLGSDYGTGAVWCRYKWTQGELAGRYVYCSGDNVAAAITGCCERVWAAADGRINASRDSAYKRR